VLNDADARRHEQEGEMPQKPGGRPAERGRFDVL
jgi:hypothetical protein